jgi:hypothetical protein
MTLRDKDKLRKAMGIQEELHAKPKRVRKPQTYPPMQLCVTPPAHPDPLARVLAWANGQATVPGLVVPTAPARAAKKTPAPAVSGSNDRELLDPSPTMATRAQPNSSRPSARAKDSVLR